MPGLLVVTPTGPDSDALCTHLRERGYVVHLAETGASAVDVALRRLPDLVLMDPALSAMDRWHAVKRLNTEITTSTIPVLTLAGDANSPAGLQRVLAKVEQTLGKRGRGSSAPRAFRPEGVPRTESLLEPEPPSESEPPRRETRTPASLPKRADRRPSTLEPPPMRVANGSARAADGATDGRAVAMSVSTIPPAQPEPRIRESLTLAHSSGVEEPPAPEAPTSQPEPPTERASSVPAAIMDLRPPDAEEGPPTSERPATRGVDGGRLLVVDDNALNRDMLSRRLTRRGYEVQVAEDGQQALDMVGAQPFDLILLDWMMPGLSGIDVLKKVREEYGPIELPVIMATAKTEPDDIVEALRHEANDYVTKPLNFDVVHARIRTQLGLVQVHRQLRASERRYRALLENTGDMILQYRLDGTLTYVSPASRALLGYEPAELQERSLFQWMHPIDRRALETQQQRQPTLPPAFTYITRMLRRDQAYLWVEVSCRLLRGEGETSVLAACRDVTEHMERLGGDEPPLPLGGDIMAHPGWRGGSRDDARHGSGGEGPSAAPTVAPAPQVKVVVLSVLDGIDAKLFDAANPAELTREVARRVSEALGKHHV